MGKNRVIGKDGDLPWKLSDDLKHFAKITRGHIVIMGRKTYESILQRLGKPLPDRSSFVITSQKDYKAPGATVCHSVDEVKQKFAQQDSVEVMVIGGGKIYQEFLPLAKTLYITEVLIECEGDTFFPDVDKNEWKIVSRKTHILVDERNSHPFTFLKLVRK